MKLSQPNPGRAGVPNSSILPNVGAHSHYTELPIGRQRKRKRVWKPTILLIDDDVDQLVLFETMLRRAGYYVIPVSSAYKGFRALKNFKVDLIVCDVMMPQIDGGVFVSEIRKSRKLSTLPVIMLTAAREDLELKLLSEGADLFCQKQNANKELVHQVELLLM